MKCAGCARSLEIGDQYIEATADEFVGCASAPGIGDLLADIMGCGNGNKIVYCEDCTEGGGAFRLNTFYGDVAE